MDTSSGSDSGISVSEGCHNAADMLLHDARQRYASAEERVRKVGKTSWAACFIALFISGLGLNGILKCMGDLEAVICVLLPVLACVFAIVTVTSFYRLAVSQLNRCHDDLREKENMVLRVTLAKDNLTDSASAKAIHKIVA